MNHSDPQKQPSVSTPADNTGEAPATSAGTAPEHGNEGSDETEVPGERKSDWRRRIRERRRAILRKIEYDRLRRIRHKTVPAYTHCKNCGERLYGMYCHRCGQYALDPEQPFWKYFKQYFENVYQFDSKV